MSPNILIRPDGHVVISVFPNDTLCTVLSTDSGHLALPPSGDVKTIEDEWWTFGILILAMVLRSVDLPDVSNLPEDIPNGNIISTYLSHDPASRGNLTSLKKAFPTLPWQSFEQGKYLVQLRN